MTTHPLASYVTLGRSGLRVSPYTLGTMTFGEDHGWGSTPAEAHQIIDGYLDAGGNSLDTANLYTNGHSEKIIGDYFAARPGRRDRIVLGTKFFGNLEPGDPNAGGVGRKGILHQLHASLRRLQTDYLDLYWVHNFDPVTPIEETLRTLDDLVTAGTIRYVGISDLPAWKVAQAAMLTDFRGWAPVTALQLEYSLLERTVEAEQLPMAQQFGLGAMPWSPLKNGWLSGRYASTRPVPLSGGRAAVWGGPTSEQYAVIDQVNAVADEIGASAAAVALAWVRSRPGVGSTIIGARSVEQLASNLASLQLQLDGDQIAALDQASAPRLPFPAGANLVAPALEYAGSTVDGRTWPLTDGLARTSTRY